MGNRIEISLSNRTFEDVTAWRGIRNAEKRVELRSPNIVADLNGQLSTLWELKTTGEITPKEYRAKQQELTSKLHGTERQRGHKPIRTKIRNA